MSRTEKGEQRSSGRRWSWGIALVVASVLVWVPVPTFVAVGNFATSHWRELLTGLALTAVAIVASSSMPHWRAKRQRDGPNGEKKPLLREIPAWSIWVGIAGLLLVGIVATWWLVSTFGSGTEQDRIKLEAIKLAGSIVVGTGGVAALVLAARRQRVSELDLLQRDRVANDNRHDANERRATELYTAAAEQLASDKAPVRMAGMYALSRLGNTNEELRQTIVNLLCAYLRMPEISAGENTPSGRPDAHQNERNSIQPSEEPQPTVMLDLAPSPLAALTALSPDLNAQKQQEHQVRLTAQRLLSQHLLPIPGEDGDPTNRHYWPGMHLDLVGASLHDWDLSECELSSANFNEAHFHGDTDFTRARFHDDIDFTNAHFHWTADFTNAIFHGKADFGNVQFAAHAGFSPAYFYGEAWFDEVNFHIDAMFSSAHFHDSADFSHAHFHRTARFTGAVADSTPIILGGARARRDLADPWVKSTWPPGWAVEVDATDSSGNQWVTLVHDTGTGEGKTRIQEGD